MKFTVTTEVDPASDTRCGSCPQIRAGKDHDHCRLFDDAVLVFDSGHWRTDKCVIAGQRAELALLRASRAVLAVNQILLTRDGRNVGNAIVTAVSTDDPILYSIKSDYGNESRALTIGEIEGMYYVGPMAQPDHKHFVSAPPASDLLDLRALETGTLLELKRDVPTLSLRAGERLLISGIGWNGPRLAPETVTKIRAHIEGAELPVLLPAAHWQLPAVVIEKAEPALLDLRTVRMDSEHAESDTLIANADLYDTGRNPAEHHASVEKGEKFTVERVAADHGHGPRVKVLLDGGSGVFIAAIQPAHVVPRVVKHACPRCDEGMREIELTKNVYTRQGGLDVVWGSGERRRASIIDSEDSGIIGVPMRSDGTDPWYVEPGAYRFVRADVPPPSEWCDGKGVK